MTVDLTQKERSLLANQRNHERLCVQKYNDYAGRASEQALQELFTGYGSQERDHYNTISGLLQGESPHPAGPQGMLDAPDIPGIADSAGILGKAGATTTNLQDATLCSDALMTERFVSSSYDEAVFDSIDPALRQALQHIQQDEQRHGEGILSYMRQNGMYIPE